MLSYVNHVIWLYKQTYEALKPISLFFKSIIVTSTPQPECHTVVF